MTNSSIDVTEVGAGVLVTRNVDGAPSGYYICTSLDINMAVGQIPVASVLIGCGVSIRDANKQHKQSAEDLLEKVLYRDAASYSGMARCSIYEAAPDLKDIEDVASKGTLLFEGVIVNGTFVYQTGKPTNKLVRLTCMNEAVNIYALPITEMTMSTGTKALSALYGSEDRSSEAETSDGSMSPAYSAYDNLEEIGLPEYSRGADIATRAAAVLACFVYAHSADGKPWELSNMNKHIPKYYNDIRKCICSSYYVDSTAVDEAFSGAVAVDKGNSPGNTFDKLLLSSLSRHFGAGSVFQVLVGTLCSDEYMLDIVPKFGDDFRLSLQPSCAWSSSYSGIVLKSANIVRAESAYSPIATLKTPDVYIVSYDELSGDCTGSQDTLTSFTQGVYAKDSSVRDKFKSVLKHGSDYKFDETLYRVKTFKAPPWLRPALSSGTGKASADVDIVSKLKSKDAPTDYNADSNIQTDAEGTGALADLIAKALFTYHYGSEDRFTLELSPSLRFGKGSDGMFLEKNLGSVISVHIGDDTDDKNMNIKGMLESISYRYAAGATSCAVSYTIVISRVRPEGDTFSIECPLYKKA